MEDAPEEFICPLTLCIMTDPVITKDGKNYDRTAILKWLAKGHENGPLTRQPLHLSSMVPNHKLKRSIQQWKAEQGLGNNDKYVEPVRSTKNLASLGLVMEFTDDMMQHLDIQRCRQPQQQQPGTTTPSRNLSDLLALYDEIIELTEGDNDRDTNNSRNGGNDSADLDDSIDAELKEIRDMFDEILELGQAVPSSS
jgi:hypothetical protein